MAAKFDVANQLDVHYDVFLYLNNKCLTLRHAKVTSIFLSAYSAAP